MRAGIIRSEQFGAEKMRRLHGIRRVGASRIVSGTRCAAVRVHAAIMCSVSICWSHSHVVGWYSYDFATVNVYQVPARRTEQSKDCPGSQPGSRFGCLVRDGGDRLAGATTRVKMGTDRAVLEKRRRWNRLLKWQEKAGEAKGTDKPVREKPGRLDDVPANAGRDTSVDVVENIVAPLSKIGAAALPAGVRLVQLTGDVDSQRSAEVDVFANRRRAGKK